MITLKLREYEMIALDSLEEGEVLETDWHGLPCFIARDQYGGMVWNGKHFYLGFYNVDEFKVSRKR